MRPLLFWFLISGVCSAEPPAWVNEPWIGLDVVPFEEGSKGISKPPAVKGVFVSDEPSSSGNVDVGRGDLISAVDGIPVETVDDYRKALSGKRGVDLKVYHKTKDKLSLRFKVVHRSVTTRGEYAKSFVTIETDKVDGTKRVVPNPEKLGRRGEVSPLSISFTLSNDGSPQVPLLMISYQGDDWLFMNTLTVGNGNDSIRMPIKEALRSGGKGAVLEVGSIPLSGDGLKAARILSEGGAVARLSGDRGRHDIKNVDSRMILQCLTAYEAYGGEWPEK